MLGFGCFNPFPFTFGGGSSAVEEEYDAMLEALRPGYCIEPNTEVNDEVSAHAQGIAMAWAADDRLANQFIPMRMMENLPVWEEATGLRPVVGDLDIERRKRLAAKFRGLAGNRLADISEACTAMLGDNFEDIVVVDGEDAIVYWPGGPPAYAASGVAVATTAPGPPGFEYSSNRDRIGIRVNKTGLSDADFFNKRAALAELLEQIVPSWMSFQIGVGTTGFTLGTSILGETFV